jgi:magnesium transporter
MDVNVKSLARTIELEIDGILQQNTEKGVLIWEKLLNLHPAEVALIFNDTADECVLRLLEKMEEKRSLAIFSKLTVPLQAHLISENHFDDDRLVYFFKKMPTDDITTMLENVPNKDLERYLMLTNKQRRERILSSLQSDDKSAGRILNSDVLFLHKELTIKKVISLLQQLDHDFEILPRQYVVSAELKLVGFIALNDLLKHQAETKIQAILRPIDVKVLVTEDQEDIVNLIRHYGLVSVPVTDENNHFLGVITTNDILDVIEEEQTEDSYKMSGIANIEHSYVDADFWTIIVQRCKFLVPLLLFQSVSQLIIQRFDWVLTEFGLIGFLTMLTGTGGNVGNQSTTVFVRGLATGEINRKNKLEVLLREVFVALAIGVVLVLAACLRIVLFGNSHLPSVCAVSLSLFFIVLTSVFLGTIIPVAFDYYDMDPAHSAAPILSTLMDVVGITIYCLIASFLLS